MSIQPFTPTGVAQKQTELYDLSDSALYLQAQAIASDFAGWVGSNFTLSTKQSGYLIGLPDFVRSEFGNILASVIMARGTVNMAMPLDYGPPRRTKQTKFTITGDVSYTPPVSGVGALEGATTLDISFELAD